MDDVTADAHAVLAADRARVGLERLRGADHAAALADDVLALPDHRNDRRALGDVLDERREEGTLREVRVVLAGELLRRHDRLDRNELVAALLKAVNDAADNLAAHTVRLDHDVRLFVRHVGQKRVGKKGMAWKVGIGFRWANTQPPLT